MLTSKLITEIIEHHSKLHVGANSCNKFVSSLIICNALMMITGVIETFAICL